MLAPLFGAAATVRAEPRSDAQRQVMAELQERLDEVQLAREQGSRATSLFRSTHAECLAVIARGQRLGIGPEEVVADHGGAISFQRAGELCEQWRTWQLLTGAASSIAAAADALHALDTLALDELSAELAAELAAPGLACLTSVDAAISAGAPTDVAVVVEAMPMTLAEGRANVCVVLALLDPGYAATQARQRATEAAALRGKYTAAGIGGAKLRLILEQGEASPLLGRGCSDGIVAPRALARATLLIQRTTTGPGLHGIRKLRFKGNRLIRSEYREFPRLEDALRWCQ